MLKTIVLALTAAIASHSAWAQNGERMCSTDGLRTFGDRGAMQVSMTGSASLPCVASSAAAPNRGVINYGNEDDVFPALQDGGDRPQALTVYLAHAEDDWETPLARSNVFALSSSDRRQILVALERADRNRFVAIYALDLDTFEEQLLGRYSLELGSREDNLMSVSFAHRHGVPGTLTIGQNRSTTTLDLGQLSSVSAFTLSSWAYGRLLGGYGDESVPTDNTIPVKIYLNERARPFQD